MLSFHHSSPTSAMQWKQRLKLQLLIPSNIVLSSWTTLRRYILCVFDGGVHTWLVYVVPVYVCTSPTHVHLYVWSCLSLMYFVLLSDVLTFVKGSVRETLTLNQKEYVAKIDQLNKNLESAWEREQKVKSLKIAIQVCSSNGYSLCGHILYVCTHVHMYVCVHTHTAPVHTLTHAYTFIHSCFDVFHSVQSFSLIQQSFSFILASLCLSQKYWIILVCFDCFSCVTHMHTRTHARTHAHTHTHTHSNTYYFHTTTL